MLSVAVLQLGREKKMGLFLIMLVERAQMYKCTYSFFSLFKKLSADGIFILHKKGSVVVTAFRNLPSLFIKKKKDLLKWNSIANILLQFVPFFLLSLYHGKCTS